jgi:DNA-binding CsgD family transcriptional regulator
MARSTDARLLDLLAELLGTLELEVLRERLLVALEHAVPSDWVSINEIGPDPADMYSVIRPAVPPRLHEIWAQYGHENPLIERFARTRDTRPYRFSDVVSQDEFRALALYREFYAVLGVEHQIAFVIEFSPPRYVGVALSRRERDFTDLERTLLDRARPYLIQIYRAAHATSTLHAELQARGSASEQVERLMQRGLTAREAAILERVAHGQANRDIAADLRVSERTVGKHLERCYRKLGVTNRSHAAAIAWDLTQPQPAARNSPASTTGRTGDPAR